MNIKDQIRDVLQDSLGRSSGFTPSEVLVSKLDSLFTQLLTEKREEEIQRCIRIVRESAPSNLIERTVSLIEDKYLEVKNKYD